MVHLIYCSMNVKKNMKHISGEQLCKNKGEHAEK